MPRTGSHRADRQLLRRYAQSRGLFRADIDKVVLRKVRNSYAAGPFVYLGRVLRSGWSPVAVLILFLVLPLGYLFEGPVGQIDEGYLEKEA